MNWLSMLQTYYIVSQYWLVIKFHAYSKVTMCMARSFCTVRVFIIMLDPHGLSRSLLS